MAFAIRLSDAAVRELDALRTFEQRRITDAMRTHLSDAPDVETRNRKPLRQEVKANFAFTQLCGNYGWASFEYFTTWTGRL